MKKTNGISPLQIVGRAPRKIVGKNMIKTYEEHVEYCMKNNIKTPKQYIKKWKENGLCKDGFISHPWVIKVKKAKNFSFDIKKK